jgi:hypothetical protein
MTDYLAQALYNSIEKLRHSVGNLNNPADLDGLVAMHFASGSLPEPERGWRVFAEPSTWLQQPEIDLSQAPQLAVLGFLVTEEIHRTGNVDDVAISAFKTHVGSLQLRKNIFSLPNSWILQPHVVLGICLGVKAAGSQPLSEWFQRLVREACSRNDIPPFLQLTYLYVSTLLGGISACAELIPTSLDVTQSSLAELALGIWLVRQGLLRPSSRDRLDWLREACSVLVRQLVAHSPYESEDFKAAIIWGVVTDYIDRWSKALVYVEENLVVGQEPNMLTLTNPQIDERARVEQQRKLSELTRKNAFLVSLSIWLICVVLVLVMSIWLPGSLSLWLSCAVAIAGLGAIIFLPWILEKSWFANPSRRFAFRVVGSVTVLAVCWAILDPSKWEVIILSVIVSGLLTLVQINQELRQSS